MLVRSNALQHYNVHNKDIALSVVTTTLTCSSACTATYAPILAKCFKGIKATYIKTVFF